MDKDIEKPQRKRFLQNFQPLDNVFAWQYHAENEREKRWNLYTYDEEKWWGDFPRISESEKLRSASIPEWAIGPFKKHPGNPVLQPSPAGWDPGHYDGGVHNGATIIENGRFSYVYRGERYRDYGLGDAGQNYQCDIGLAVSENGTNFIKDNKFSPFFAKGSHADFSYEDVCLVKYQDTYYLYCNQWDWHQLDNYQVSGVFCATSKDLKTWTRHGILFPNAETTHRNPVVLQNPDNQAVRLPNGKFMMFINNGIVAYSDDLIHWDSRTIGLRWPGGEGCVAMCQYNENRLDDIVLFTGGHHTGHFYAIGEVLFSLRAPEEPLDFLLKPILHADPKYPYEDGYSIDGSERISSYRDCIFFNALSRHNGKWWLYYGGSEYYTCLATCPFE